MNGIVIYFDARITFEGINIVLLEQLTNRQYGWFIHNKEFENTDSDLVLMDSLRET